MDCTSVILMMAMAAGLGQAASSELKKTPVQPAPAGSMASVEITLTPVVGGGKNAIQWSPYGQRCPLTETAQGLETKIALGPKDAPPIAVALSKTQGSQYYNMISIDHDRNGVIANNERFTTKPNLSRGKMWSQFETVVPVPATDPKTGKGISNPYKLNLWYVEEPDAGAEKILRYSRDWWLEGQGTIDGVRAVVLISENVMDGVIDAKDRWALSSVVERKQLYLGDSARPITDFAWLGEKAYRIRSVHPSGRQIVLERYDPGVTRKDDAVKRDSYDPDRKAARSGKSVNFLTELISAQRDAQREKKNLFVKFEADWCGPCKMMDELVYTADEVAEASRQVVCVKIDGDRSPALVKRFDVKGYPTMILLSPDGKELKRVSGYVGVRQMKQFLAAKP